jgi:hypothetical protein
MMMAAATATFSLSLSLYGALEKYHTLEKKKSFFRSRFTLTIFTLECDV